MAQFTGKVTNIKRTGYASRKVTVKDEYLDREITLYLRKSQWAFVIDNRTFAETGHTFYFNSKNEIYDIN